MPCCFAGFTDNATVNVFPSNADGSEVLAVTESVKGTYRLDTATLATKCQEKYTDRIKGDLNTAHPKVLPSGEVVNIVVGFGKTFSPVILDIAAVLLQPCRMVVLYRCWVSQLV